MGHLFIPLLGTESDAALAVFLNLRRARNQREGLAAAARFKLVGADFGTFKALMTVYGSLEAERNTLAQSFFGICPEDANLLYCIEINTMSTSVSDRFVQIELVESRADEG